MAARLEIIISYNKELNKHYVEYSTDVSQDITNEERKTIAQLRSKLLSCMDNEYISSNQSCIH